MTLEQLIEQAWNDHADSPRTVADRLAAALPSVTEPQHVAPFARIVTHVYGEHLGEWARGIALLEALRGARGYTGAPEVGGFVTRSVATLRYAGGDASALASLSADDRASALATAASAFTGREDFERALDTYAQAVALAPGLPRGSIAFRALAIGGNNLAAALERKSPRDEAQTQGMVAAARGGLEFWRIAGTWLEEERALYRLARSLVAAGQPLEAVEMGKQCAQICIDHDAPPFERFFAYAVLAHALRESGRADDYAGMREEALAWFDRVPQEERQWCESDLAELAY